MHFYPKPRKGYFYSKVPLQLKKILKKKKVGKKK